MNTTSLDNGLGRLGLEVERSSAWEAFGSLSWPGLLDPCKREEAGRHEDLGGRKCAPMHFVLKNSELSLGVSNGSATPKFTTVCCLGGVSPSCLTFDLKGASPKDPKDCPWGPTPGSARDSAPPLCPGRVPASLWPGVSSFGQVLRPRRSPRAGSRGGAEAGWGVVLSPAPPRR